MNIKPGSHKKLDDIIAESERTCRRAQHLSDQFTSANGLLSEIRSLPDESPVKLLLLKQSLGIMLDLAKLSKGVPWTELLKEVRDVQPRRARL